MLRHEDRMSAPWRLPSVVPRRGGGEPLIDEFPGLLHDSRKPPGLNVGQFAALEAELSAERRGGQTAECGFQVDHWHKF
jgi:hypothetical protein